MIKEGSIGWEDWLEQVPKGRWAEKFFVLSIHILFSVYSLMSIYLIYIDMSPNKLFGSNVIMILIAVLFAIFAVSLFVVITSLPTRTSIFNNIVIVKSPKSE